MKPTIGTTFADSTPAFAPARRPPAGAPNVVLVVLDDLGFAQLGCFGSDLATPNLDRLAAGGLRYNRFHVTALCSPTRACLLTGRNHHAVGMGFLPDIPVGFPGYHGRIPKSAATLPRVLRDAGYSTVAVGKWHLTPRWELSAAGPFERWPLGMGFERYYGFLGGDTNQWAPILVSDNGFVTPPRAPEAGYHLTEDLVDRAIRFILDQQHIAPDKPFFLYFAPGAMHAPHHVAPEWSAPYRGRFDAGWEAWRDAAFVRQQAQAIVPAGTTLTPRPSWVREWSALTADERRLLSRMMEVFAGFLSHTDAQLGRLIDFLARIDRIDNTLLLVCSDNGTSAEGGPLGSLNEHRMTHDLSDDPAELLRRIDDIGGFRAYNHYAWGWAWAGNTPFRLWKRYAWLGGVRTPLIVHWPRAIAARGEIRSQFCHAVDVPLTVLDAAGIPPPEMVDGVAQQPTDGASLLSTFADAGAPSPRQTQYFEILGSRAMYHAGWKATTDHVGGALTVESELLEGSRDFERDSWALFHLDEDFSEARDVAAVHPDRLRQLIELWWSEAGRNHVMPLGDSFIGRAPALEPSPFGLRHRAVYLPGGGAIAEDMLPPLMIGFRLLATVEIPPQGAQGILVALGDWHNGFACYVSNGYLAAAFSLFGEIQRTSATEPVSAGEHVLGFEYTQEVTGGGPVTLLIDGRSAGDMRLSRNLPFRWQIAGGGLLIGHDRGFPVCDDYQPPFPFTGTMRQIVIEIPALAPRDGAELVRAALRHE